MILVLSGIANGQKVTEYIQVGTEAEILPCVRAWRKTVVNGGQALCRVFGGCTVIQEAQYPCGGLLALVDEFEHIYATGYQRIMNTLTVKGFKLERSPNHVDGAFWCTHPVLFPHLNILWTRKKDGWKGEVINRQSEAMGALFARVDPDGEEASEIVVEMIAEMILHLVPDPAEKPLGPIYTASLQRAQEVR